MLRIAGQLPDGRPYVAFGVTDDDWARFRHGAPETINLQPDVSDELPALQVVLLGGETEDAILADMWAMGWTRDRSQPVERQALGRLPFHHRRSDGDG